MVALRNDLRKQKELSRELVAYGLAISAALSFPFSVVVSALFFRLFVSDGSYGALELLSSFIGSFLAFITCAIDWSVLFFRQKTPLLLVIPHLPLTLITATFLVSTGHVVYTARW